MSTTTTTKKELIDWITKLDDEAMLENVKMLKDSNQGKDWWDEISQAEKEGIQRGLEDANDGRVISNKEFWKKHADRL